MFQQTKNFLLEKMTARPSVAVVLGSGLGGFADELEDRVEIP
jgi:purine nucleoside phosphorylase